MGIGEIRYSTQYQYYLDQITYIKYISCRLECESKPVYPDEFRFRLEEKDREFFRELSIYADEIKHKLQCLYSNMELNQKEDTLKEHMK